MAIPLNTTINGSVGTCYEGAEWCTTLGGKAEDAGQWFYWSLASAESGWEGPAHEAFGESMNGVGGHLDDLDHTARAYGRALEGFAAMLEKAIEWMNQALDKAVAGDLDVEAPFIYPPEDPGAPPEPRDFATNDQIPEALSQFEVARNVYNDEVRIYNARRAVFHECQELVRDAREKEAEAHANLEAELGSTAPEVDGMRFGLTTAANVLNSVANLENDRRAALTRFNELTGKAHSYQNFGVGNFAALSESDRAALNRAARKAGPGAEAYKQRIREYSRLLDKLPNRSVDWISNYPGKGARPPGSGRAASVLRGLPYVSSLTVLGTEIRDAWTGEQSWGEAGARATAGIGGAWALSKVGASKGAFFGPWGALIGGFGMGALGGFGGQKVVDFFTPGAEDELYAPLPDRQERPRVTGHEQIGRNWGP